MTKINFCGRWERNEGYGSFTYNFYEQLYKLGVDLAPVHLSQLEDWQQEHFRSAGYDTNRPMLLIHPPDNVYVTKLPGRVWCFTMFESTGIPKEWAPNLNSFCDRLIVPTQFCKDIFENAGVNKPIDIVPGGIDPTMPIFREEMDRPYTFMCLGDRGGRKGHDLVWRAFYDVFGDDPNVRLITKMRQDPEGVVRYLSESDSDYRISLFKGDMRNAYEIYSNADCFVFPTRGEGYGLPPREAAACGIPTICTSWGALEDCKDWAIPIGYKLDKAIPPLIGLWAEPDYNELKEAMWKCYAERNAVKRQAIKNAEKIRETMTWAHAAKKLYDLMQEKLS